MKKIRIFMFLVLSLLLSNCGKEEKKAEVAVTEIKEDIASTFPTSDIPNPLYVKYELAKAYVEQESAQ